MSDKDRAGREALDMALLLSAGFSLETAESARAYLTRLAERANVAEARVGQLEHERGLERAERALVVGDLRSERDALAAELESMRLRVQPLERALLATETELRETRFTLAPLRALREAAVRLINGRSLAVPASEYCAAMEDLTDAVSELDAKETSDAG